MPEPDLTNYLKLREIVLRDPELQNTLIPIGDREEFIEQVIAMASDLGITLAREEILEAMRIHGRAWIERWI